MSTQQCEVVIIGGGISGLCVAHWLKKRNVDAVVLEKDAETGGTMKSVREDGFLVETGPNSALETTPLFKELVADCNLEDEFKYANPASKNRYILRDGRLQALPLNPIAFLKTNLFSNSGKLRLLKELFIGKADREESIAEFVTRRLGKEFLDYAIDPFVAGVFAGRPEALSVRAAFPKLYALEEKYGGLIKGMVKGRKERKTRAEKAKDRAESFSFRSGMQVLPQAIATRLGNNVITNATVTSLHTIQQSGHQLSDKRFLVNYSRNGIAEQITANAVVLSVPAYAAAELIRQYSSSTAATLESVYYPPVASVYVGFEQKTIDQSLDGFGFLIPARENRKILGCLWSSSLFSGRAPQGMVSFTAFIGGSRQPDFALLDEETLCDVVLTDLKNIMQIRGKHVYLKVTRWKQAIPQYELGYHQKIKDFNQFELEHPGLFFCSNFKGGISVGDCVKSAYETAEIIGAAISLSK